MTTTTQTNKRIFRFDASLLKQFSCDLRIKLIAFDGFREKKIYNDTNYGTAFHKFSSRMYESGGNFQEAVKAAKEIINKPCVIRSKKDHLTEQHLLKTCFEFWETFETSNNNFHLLINPEATCWKCNGNIIDNNIPCETCKGVGHLPTPMVEQSFEINIRETSDYIIYACGTIDKIGKFNNGCYAIGDIKTTSSWNFEAFLSKWKLNPQLQFYIWAIHKLVENDPNSLLAEMTKTKIGAFIDGVFLKSSKDTEFKRSEVFVYTNEERATFAQMLEKAIDRYESLVQDYLANRVILPTGMINESCHKAFTCKFYDYCACANKQFAANILSSQFTQRPYDPLNF